MYIQVRLVEAEGSSSEMSLRSAAASALTRAVQFTKEKLGVDEGEITGYDRHFDILAERAGLLKQSMNSI